MDTFSQRVVRKCKSSDTLAANQYCGNVARSNKVYLRGAAKRSYRADAARRSLERYSYRRAYDYPLRTVLSPSVECPGGFPKIEVELALANRMKGSKGLLT
jgi:hypothetical protein